jgi:DNA-binding NtrC family response regulator
VTIRHNLSKAFERLGVDTHWVSTVDECRQIHARDTIDLIFCSERVEDGNYWDICGALTRGLKRKPKVVLVSNSLGRAECEEAERCGIFAVLRSSCEIRSIEWTIILAKRTSRRSRQSGSGGLENPSVGAFVRI